LLNRILIYYCEEKAMKKIALVLVILLAVSTVVFARGATEPTSGSGSGAVRIALVMRNMDEDFLAIYANNVRRLAAERGVELNIQDARSDGATQLTQVQTLLNQGYRHFVIIPVVSELSEQMNRDIQARGGGGFFFQYPAHRRGT
jgi:ABC-type sugar transport system substrate-binding protein